MEIILPQTGDVALERGHCAWPRMRGQARSSAPPPPPLPSTSTSTPAGCAFFVLIPYLSISSPLVPLGCSGGQGVREGGGLAFMRRKLQRLFSAWIAGLAAAENECRE